MASNNQCSKRVPPEEAYEVYQSLDGEWTYYVLKKYQSSEKEAQNPYARWYCMTVSLVCPKGDYGDAYVSSVKDGTVKLDYNPLVQTTGGQDEAGTTRIL